MLIPSIDLMGGKIVQLVQGERKSLEFDDREPWIARFLRYPLVQLIDLDAAMGNGRNWELVSDLVRRLPCQVGGGIRSAAEAEHWLSAGARRVIFGSALYRGDDVNEDFARSLAASLPVERLTFAVDARDGRVAVGGWRSTIALRPADAMRALEPYCGAFLYTHIATEGLMRGFPFEQARALRAATGRQLICAGGITTWDEINRLHDEGIDAVVGMAIYREALAV